MCWFVYVKPKKGLGVVPPLYSITFHILSASLIASHLLHTTNINVFIS